MGSLVTILPICSYIERKGCMEDSLVHHNTCSFYVIEMATILYAAYLGQFATTHSTVCGIQICCYTINKVLWNLNNTVSTLLKWPQYCMLHTFDGLQLHVRKHVAYRFVAILSTKYCEIWNNTVFMLLKWPQYCMLHTWDGLQLHIPK